jgi:transcriptional regulator
MQAHSFITLIGYDGIYPVATQIPVHMYQDEKGTRLVGHIMKKTDHYLAYAKNENVLALFTGANAYVSASVYENPAVASTWNYSSVQAKGKIRLMNKDETREVIKHLTNSYEDPAKSPAAFHKMDDAYIESNLKAISGFEIRVEEINSVFKLNQNHSATIRQKLLNIYQKATTKMRLQLPNK